MKLKDKRINKETPVPLYYQLKEILREYIRSSSIDDSIPTENELCQHFEVSRPTVRQAITELVSEGYLRRSKGKGTFIAQPKIRRDFLLALESFNTEMRRRGIAPTTKVLVLSLTEPDEIVKDKLMLTHGSKVVYLRRLRFADGDPLMIVNSFLPYDRLPGFEQFDFEQISLHSAIEKNYPIRLERAVRSIEAIACSTDEAPLLGIEPMAPVQYLETLVYTTEDWPVEFSTAWYRGDRSRFTVQLGRTELPRAQ